MSSKIPFCHLVVLDPPLLPLNFPQFAATSTALRSWGRSECNWGCPLRTSHRAIFTVIGGSATHGQNAQTGHRVGRGLTTKIPLRSSGTRTEESSLSRDRIKSQHLPTRGEGSIPHQPGDPAPQPLSQAALPDHQKIANSDHAVLTGIGPSRPRRNGSHSLADGRPQPRKTLPLKLSQPRSAACPWLRSSGTGQRGSFPVPEKSTARAPGSVSGAVPASARVAA